MNMKLCPEAQQAYVKACDVLRKYDEAKGTHHE